MLKTFSAAFVRLFFLISVLFLTTLVVADTVTSNAVRLVPVGISITSDDSLPAEVQQIEADALPFAFDRDGATELTLFETAQVEIALEDGATPSALRVRTPAPYTISVATLSGNGRNQSFAPISAVQGIDLSILPDGWHSLPFGGDVASEALELTLTPVAGAAATGLPEIEVWGGGTSIRTDEIAVALDALGNADAAAAFRRVESNGTLSVSARNPVVSATLDMPFAPQDIRRAWLVYELRGVHSWLAVRRAINGAAPAGGYVAAEENRWSQQIEPISPAQLVQGANSFEFGTLAGQERGYRLRGLSLVVELDDGQHLLKGGTVLTDGDVTTGWAALAEGGGGARMELPLVQTTAIGAFDLTLAAPISGYLTVEAVTSDGVEVVLDAVDPATDPRVSANGTSYVIDMGGAVAHAVAVTLSSSFEVTEADVNGSPMGPARTPAQIVVSWPQAGEFYGRTGFLRGHALPATNASGPADFFVAGLPFDAPNGVFEVAISKDQAGFQNDADETPWSVEIVALYPDGTSVTEDIVFDAPVFIDGLSTYTPDVLSETFMPDEEKTVTHEGAELTMAAGALDEATTFRISALTDIELARLDTGLINVTKGPRRGYRMLPHAKFNAQNRLRLPFSPNQIPQGYTAADVQIFYFDEDAGRWMALENTAVDTAEEMVAADTDHFTDFIAGVVVAPESPQVASFNPTQLKDMKVADPSARINLIAAPQATNTGDAGMSYPLELPPGRQGLAPQLGLQYNSAGGNGWMGLGWSMSTQEVSIDTRWGVPRYDAAQETETYLWNGQQLTPVAHRGTLVPREAERVFHTRVEGAFNRIIRHGDSPTNYWWEVTDKMGTRYAYGGDLDSGQQVGSAVLADDSGNVFKWALTEVRDTNGNRVEYSHVTVVDTGLSLGSVPGRQLYCDAIRYTGDAGGPGPFEVKFIRDRDLPNFTRRSDTIIDGRGGFKMVTADLLRRVEITYNNIQVRAYEFDYTEGAFYKQLLQSVTQFDAQNEPFNTHTFDYFDDARDGTAYNGFQPSVQWAQSGADDNVSLDAFLGGIEASSISGTESDSRGWHFHGGIGLGPTKFASVGFKYGRSSSDMNGRLMLLDLNGDGLTDKVFVSDDNRVFWRRNESGPLGAELFATPVLIGDLNAILRESSSTTSKGVEIFLGASLGLNDADTVTTTSIYFTDANGDGLPDLNLNGSVLFNVLDNNGTPTFIANSATSAYPIGPAAVDGAAVAIDFAELLDDLITTAPLIDNLRVWTAPFSGTVDISGSVQLIADTSPERADYTTADGVRATIELNGVQLLIEDISATDYVARPTNVTALTVAKGDQLYFRVQSNFDGRFDQVDWAPSVNYTNFPSDVDANGLSATTYVSSNDFALFANGATQIAASFNGQLRLEGILAKTSTTSDDVTVSVRKISRDLSDVLTTAVLGTQTIDWDATGVVSLDALAGGSVAVQKTETVQVQVGVDTNGDPIFETEISQWADQIEVSITTDSPIDLSALTWNEAPVSFYSAITDPGQSVTDANGDFTTIQPIAPAITLFSETDQSAPLQAWTAPVTGTVDLATAITVNDPGLDTTLWLTVKSNGQRVAKEQITIVGGVATIPPLSFAAILGERYFFEVSGADPGTLSGFTVNATTVTLPDTTSVSAPSGANGAGEVLRVSQSYRGWSTFGYDGNKSRADLPINLTTADLALPTAAELAAQEAAVQAAINSNDPAQIDAVIASFSPKVFGFSPNAALSRWTTVDEDVWTTATGASTSRFGDDFPSVPDPTVFAGAQAVSRIAQTDNDGLTAGLFFVSGAKADTDTVSILDFLDMNGDRFPDVVSTNRMVQYSPMIGGLEPAAMNVAGMETAVRTSSGESTSFGIGGTFPIQLPSGSGALSPNGTGRDPGASGTQMASLGVSGNFSEGTSDVGYDLRDMNADGLPDLVRQGATLDVAFNLGYRFAQFETFSPAAIGAQINDGEYQSLGGGLSVGFNDGIYGFAGSLNRSQTENKARESLLDINGDGLIDRVREGSSAGALRVRLNSGNGFQDEISWPTGTSTSGLADSLSISDSAGGYVTFTPGFIVYLILNPGADVSESMSRSEITIQDMDGDGFPEYLTSSDSDQLSVSLDTIERTNMLRQVNRPLGSTITLAYERSGNTIDQPQNKWVLARVEVFDGFAGDGTDTLATNFTYEDGYWDREEREFFGYARVIEDHMNVDAVGGEAVYRTITRDFLNDTYYEKGLLASSTTADAGGNLYLETANTYTFVDIDTGTEVSQPDSLTATVFPQLIRTDNQFYEGQAVAGKATFMTYAYDALGNVVEYFDAANLDTTADDVTSVIGYHSDQPAYIVGKADSVVVTGQGGTGPGGAYRNREATFETGTGNLLQLRSVLADGSAAVTDMTYDGFGNLTNVTGPANVTGQRYALAYVFDPEVATYVTGITDSFGYTSAATYDVRFGELLSTTDLNGQPMTYTLDDVGRVVTVTGPYQAGTGFDTITFAYNPLLDVPGDDQYPDVDVSWALTQHIDVYRNIADPIETAMFIDGLGRALQTKKDAAIGDASGVNDRMVASGRITFDFLGRQTEQYYPVIETLGQAGVFNSTYDSITPTLTDYDILDRPVRVTIPDGSATQMTYDFGPDRGGVQQFRTLFVDAEGNRRETFADVRKLMTSVKEINPAGGQPTIWTSYVYDPLRQITDVTDDQGNITLAEYDNFGRMTALDSPDMGRTTYGFDLASNLTTKQTANLATEGTAITYAYDFNRLETVTYPTFTENNVTYTYGAPGAADNRANRIVTVTSEGGVEERFYGPLGEMVRQIRTINSDTQGNSANSPEVYTTEWTYDTWNRLQSMVYPDGEILTNLYDSGGKLRQIDGQKTGFDYPYLRQMTYDEFGQRTYVEAGNGTETSYAYVPTTRRLDGLLAGNAQGRTFQDLSYAYDLVGNITAQSNAATVNGANQLGGATAFTYQYDDLYRLTAASGVWEYQPNKTESFTLDMAYDTIHNIATKDQRHIRTTPSGTEIEQQKTTYDWTYDYASAQPHAPSLIGERAYSYDLNGNQTGWDSLSNGTRRTIVWDEENRIQSVADNGRTQTYKYDDAGERVIKRGAQGETAYVNQFFTVRNREVSTMHVFAGGTRMVSKLVRQPRDVDGDGVLDPIDGCANPPWGWTNGNGGGNGNGNAGGNGNGQGPCGNNGNGNGGGSGPEVFERDQYFYHPDHLGSSSYVTDVDGEIFQHLEYFPFGETWVEESSNTQRTPYLFTGKELDEQTGLYYFGARYYDPRTSVWQSPDPILASYLTGKPAGGVFQSLNLNLYAYAGQKPVMQVDPTGEWRTNYNREPGVNFRVDSWQDAERAEVIRLINLGHTILSGRGENGNARMFASYEGDLYAVGREPDIISIDENEVVHFTEIKFRSRQDTSRDNRGGNFGRNAGRSLSRLAAKLLGPVGNLPTLNRIRRGGGMLRQLHFDVEILTNDELGDVDLSSGFMGRNPERTVSQDEIQMNWVVVDGKGRGVGFGMGRNVQSAIEDMNEIIDRLLE